MKDGGSTSWRALAIAALAALVLFLAFYNLDRYPPIWYDEGIHLLFAQRLAKDGLYGFGPALGPTVFFPVAAAFRVAGVGLVSARVVMAGYLCLCVAVFYALARYLGDWRMAVVGTLLLIVSPGVNLLRWGRQMLGEVPAMLFALLSVLTWMWALDARGAARRWLRLLLCGAFLALAILTKNQFFLLLPAWFLVWLADRLYYRQGRHVDLAIPAATAILCVASWYVIQRYCFPVGERLAEHNVEEWSSALQRGILNVSVERTIDALKFLFGQNAFYLWIVPGGVYGAILSLRRSKEGLKWALLLAVAAVWLGWYVFASVGWPRYACLPLALIALFIARLFSDLTIGYWFSAREVWRAAASGQWDLDMGRRVALMALLVAMLLRLLAGRLGDVIVRGDDSPQQMAAYIVENLPRDTQIATYEPEICFLTGYKCVFPPYAAFNVSIQHVWYGGPPPSQFYDVEALNAPYLLIGNFGRWVQIYDEEMVDRIYEPLTTVGEYELYRAKTIG